MRLKIVDHCDRALDAVTATDGYSLAGDDLVWLIETLPPGKSIRLQVNCKCVSPSAKACNRMTVTSQEGARGEAQACLEIVAVAAAEPSDLAPLRALLEAARSKYQPIAPAEFQRAKTELLGAVASLDAYLARLGANGVAWKTYLKWNQLEAQLAAGAQPDPRQLHDVLRQYYDKYPGLELIWFTNVRYWLKAYVDRLEAAADPDARGQYKAQLDAIGHILDDYRQGKPIDSRSLGRILGTLQKTSQAPELVAALRRRFSRPNALVHATARLVTAGIDRQVDDTLPLEDNILGTSIRGTGRTVGQVTGELLADPRGAAIVTTLTGTTSSTTVGYNGPAIVHATAETSIWGRKLLYFDALGLHTQPAEARAVSNSVVTGVGSNRGPILGKIVSRAARNRIPEQKPASDRVGSEHARERVASRLDAEADALIERANRAYNEKVRGPLVRQDAFPRQVEIASTPQGVDITLTESSDELLGAPGHPPELPQRGVAYLQLHESFINNLAADMLGGRTLNREDVERGATDTLGSLPESMKKDEDEGAPWAIEFAKVDPVSLALDHDEAEITIRGQRYKSGSRTFPGMTVAARYKLVSTPQGMRADRQGELVIYPPALGPGKSMGVREKVVEKMLRKRFNKIFEERVVFHGLKLPGNWVKLGPLTAHNFKTERGWLLIAWDE